jgi:hypothetical protein
MNARNVAILFIAALLAALAGNAVAAAPEAASIIERLARPAPAITSFVEVRHAALLTRPLVVRGELEYRGPRALEKRVEAPWRERLVINGNEVQVLREGEKPRRFSLNRAPELRGILDSFGALLAGDRSALEASYAMSVEGSDDAWRLSLKPRDPRAARYVRDVVVTGGGSSAWCFVMTEPDGDASYTLLDAASKVTLPEPPTRAWLEQHCRDGGKK